MRNISEIFRSFGFRVSRLSTCITIRSASVAAALVNSQVESVLQWNLCNILILEDIGCSTEHYCFWPSAASKPSEDLIAPASLRFTPLTVPPPFIVAFIADK